jgi:hypothetical protein
MIMKRNSDLHVYCKTLYWTLLNYISVYRNLSTGMVEASDQARTTEQQAKMEGMVNIASKIMDQVASTGVEIAKSIPFVGTAVAALDGLIGVCWEAYKDMVLQAKIEAI